jgi:replicative DNA helicase
MNSLQSKTIAFRKSLEKLSREDLIEIIKDQDVETFKQINRIEWVFKNKLNHLNWASGEPIMERPLTNRELALLVDEPFELDLELMDLGISAEQQRQIHIAKDPCVWARQFLEAETRVYQTLILRDPSVRKVLRAGRRLGKTFSMAIALIHYSYTHKDGRCLVIAPMKSHVELIYQEILRLASKNEIVTNSITRKVTSPQFMIQFSNGSTIRFFTSGMRSGGKTDVARGQEAHMIVLDEMDYMHADDLDALYAMLQKTAEDQPDKVLIGASTPTGRRERFWEWCRSERFKEFWFPSYCNPYFSKDQEDEFREQYSEIGYRHEIEADWGEDAEGVYPRKYVDKAFMEPGWDYHPELTSARSFHTIGVDWDKYGAGTNIVVLEACSDSYEEERFRNKVKICYREEIPRSEYTLTKAVSRIVELNNIFKPKHIYVDRGYGEVQVELLHKYGVENPVSGLKERVKGVSFSETIDVKDPYTKQNVKKEIKPYMVDNLRQYLEKEVLAISERDAEIYMQLISYVVVRTTQTGRPVFEAGGSAVDHAHDALILALLAITENYSDLHKARFASRTESFSNTFFMPKPVNDNDDDKDDKIGTGLTGRADKLMPSKFGYKKSFGGRSNSKIKRKTF